VAWYLDKHRGKYTFTFATGCGVTQSPIQWVPGALNPRLMRPERKADHSPPSNDEVKNIKKA